MTSPIVGDRTVANTLRAVRAEKGTTVTVERALMVALLNEVQTLRAALPPLDRAKLDHVQALTLNFAVAHIVDMLGNMVDSSWDKLAVSEVLAIVASEVKAGFVGLDGTPGHA